MSKLIEAIPKSWVGVDLPGVRPHPDEFSTYSGFRGSMPPMPKSVDDEFSWLASKPVVEGSLLTEESIDEFRSAVPNILQHKSPSLPTSFVKFLTNLNLADRIRSCTACYLQLPHYVVRTTGVEDGVLIHFLSDQQWCVHWSLYLNTKGAQAVLASSEFYGYSDEEQQYDHTPVDLIAEENIWVCAMSFTEFMYRYWIENEIWYAGFEYTRRTLTAEEQEYVNFYSKA